MSCGGCAKLIEAASTQTGCECKPESFPFICPRHGDCEKTAHFHMLCRSRIEHYETYEAGGRELCINPPKHARGYWIIGVGDVMAAVIKVATFGLVKMCATCRSRRMWLNRRFPVLKWKR